MYRALLICLCLAAAFAVRADYRIEKMNTPAITVGGKALHVNDIFPPSAPIRWTDDRQAIVVADTDSGGRMLVVAEQFRAADAATMRDYIEKKKTPSDAKPGIEELKSVLAGRHYLLDTLAIETCVPTDSRHFFFISYPFTDHEVSKWVDNTDGTFTLHKGLFPSGGLQDNGEILVKVYFYDKTTGTVTPVCEKMTMVILPRQL